MNRDEVIDTLKEEWQKLISWCPEITDEFEDIVQTVVKSDGSLILTHEGLNKLLLCRDQNIVGKSFFEYFFEGESVRTIEQFQKGVEKFRVKALLLYGNFQYAFRSFRQRENLKQFIHEKGFEPITEGEFLQDRENPPAFEDIDDKERWMVGQITFPQEVAELEKAQDRKEAEKVKERADTVKEAAKRNLRKYLTLDCLDVYVATSMRERNDYQKMAQFVREVFKNDALKRLKLRYFDYTTCYSADIVAVGLLQGLMLKRAKALLYHAGESDSFGKDSELAAVLAQGKPAIVYVEEVDPADPRYQRLEDRFEQFDQRHPLALQIALNTGVAQGIMVVRDLQKCAHLLYDVLLHNLKTKIDEESTVVRLRLDESTYGSDSTIHVATRDTLLSRSFWNYYFPRECEDIPAHDGGS